MLQKIYGPLHDDDRIFTNLYGRHDWRLKGALSRVCCLCITCSFCVHILVFILDSDNLLCHLRFVWKYEITFVANVIFTCTFGKVPCRADGSLCT